MTPPLRRVLVVGGSSGIGRSLAVALGRRGHPVVVVARRADTLADAVAAAGPTAAGLVGDVTDAGRCRTLVEEAATALGGLDAVVHAAGGVTAGRRGHHLGDGVGRDPGDERGRPRARRVGRARPPAGRD